MYTNEDSDFIREVDLLLEETKGFDHETEAVINKAKDMSLLWALFLFLGSAEAESRLENQQKSLLITKVIRELFKSRIRAFLLFIRDTVLLILDHLIGYLD